MSGGLASLQAFCQWKIEHQVRKCCMKGLILRNVAGTSSITASPKFRDASILTLSEEQYSVQDITVAIDCIALNY